MKRTLFSIGALALTGGASLAWGHHARVVCPEEELIVPCIPPPPRVDDRCYDAYRAPFFTRPVLRAPDEVPISNTVIALRRRQRAIYIQRENIAFEQAMLAASPSITQPMVGTNIYGSTFGGGPLACAAARATLEAFAELSIDGEDITTHVTAVGDYAREKLAELPFISEVRGIGLMIGMTLVDDAPLSALQLRDALAEQGFIVNAIGQRIIRLLPPLICTTMHIDRLIAAIYAIMIPSCEEAT